MTGTAVPRYLEIERALEKAILSGEWPPGHRVPSEHELVERFGCSRMTVNKALTKLADAGLVERRRRAGTVVARGSGAETVLEIHDIKAEIEASGRAYRNERLSREKRRATALDAGRLGVTVGAPVLALAFRHFADERPFVLEERLINLASVPEAEQEDFAAMPPGSWLLARAPWSHGEHIISAVNADETVAERLAIAPGSACMVMERRTWQEETSITWAMLVYRGASHRLIARFSPGGRR